MQSPVAACKGTPVREASYYVPQSKRLGSVELGMEFVVLK